MCFVVGPFKKDSDTDRAVAALQVDIKTFAVMTTLPFIVSFLALCSKTSSTLNFTLQQKLDVCCRYCE